MRYFDFIKEIKEISTSHILVNEYGEGDIYEYLNNGEHKYPCVFLTVTNLTTTDSGTAINFTLFYTDRLVENQANKTAIQSTGISVIKQILSRYEQLHPEYLLSNVNYTPFTEKFTDMCAGVFCDVVIENQIDTLEDYDNECEEGAFTVKTITLTKNGIYDIVGYDSAIVLVETPMETITITENGVYVPEEGGYNEVIVEVPETGTPIQKTKVLSIDIDNSCIYNGTWSAENIDTILVNNMNGVFYYCTSLQSLDVSNWDTSNVTNMDYMFYECNNLQTVGDISNWNVSNVTDMSFMFRGCYNLQSLNLSNWDISNVTNLKDMFYYCDKLETIGDITGWDASNVTDIERFAIDTAIKNFVGDRTIDDVINNNITILNGLKVSSPFWQVLPDETDRASLRALINGLSDMTGQPTKTLRLYAANKEKLTTEDIAIATDKNWTIS